MNVCKLFLSLFNLIRIIFTALSDHLCLFIIDNYYDYI